MQAQINQPLIERLVQSRSGVSFADCLNECVNNKEMVANFDKLKGTNLSLNGSLLDLEIDRATGRLDNDVKEFIDFCWDFVFLRF